jgi:hypothetical protein
MSESIPLSEEGDDPQQVMAIAGLVTLACVLLEGGKVDLNIEELDKLAELNLDDVLEFEVVGDPQGDRGNAWLRVKANLPGITDVVQEPEKEQGND